MDAGVPFELFERTVEALDIGATMESVAGRAKWNFRDQG